LQKAGAVIKEVSLPHTKYAIADYYIICTAEASRISHDMTEPDMVAAPKV
jgi:hypothetical protein